MRAEVKRSWSVDLPDARSLPENPEDCCVGVQADIGPVGEEGADTFSFQVCTPSALARQFETEQRPFWARATLLVATFTWETVEAALEQYVASVTGRDWKEVATELNRFMYWEFEDY